MRDVKNIITLLLSLIVGMSAAESFPSIQSMTVKSLSTLIIWIALFAYPNFVSAQNCLNLEQSIAAVKKQNLGLEIEKQKIFMRTIDVNKTRLDGLPTLNFTSDYENVTGIDTLKNSADLSWDFAARAKNTGNPQQLRLKAAKQHKTATEALLVYQVKVGYYRLMQVKHELAILQKKYDLLDTQRMVTAQFVASQLKLKSALGRIDDQLNNVRNQILLKQEAVSQTRSALLHLINIPDTGGISFTEGEKLFIPLPSRSKVMEKLLTSPEVQIMNFEQRAISESIHPTWMDKLPVMNLSTGYQQEWPVANNGIDVHLVFSFPLMDMGRARARNAGIEAQVAKKRLEAQQKVKVLAERIASLYEQAELNRTMFIAYQKTHEHSLKTLELANNEYEVGLLTEPELISSERDTIDAEQQMNRTYYDYMGLLAEIDYLQGAVH